MELQNVLSELGLNALPVATLLLLGFVSNKAVDGLVNFFKITNSTIKRLLSILVPLIIFLGYINKDNEIVVGVVSVLLVIASANGLIKGVDSNENS